MNKRTILSAILALSLSTTSAFATGIPVSCSDGTRLEPVPPTWVEEVIIITPDIYHPAATITIPSTAKGSRKQSATHAGKKVCVLTLRSGELRRNLLLQPDCLTPWPSHWAGETNGDGGHGTRKAIPAYTEDVPDDVIPAHYEENPPIEVATRTIKLLVGFTGPIWNPKPKYEEVTQDGSCPSH